MRRPAPVTRLRRRGRLLTALVGAALAVALGLTGAVGLGSGGAVAGHGHGHGVHTDVQSWS
jgi:hypothetical protein